VQYVRVIIQNIQSDDKYSIDSYQQAKLAIDQEFEKEVIHNTEVVWRNGKQQSMGIKTKLNKLQKLESEIEVMEGSEDESIVDEVRMLKADYIDTALFILNS
jgi:hypothetical protein